MWSGAALLGYFHISECWCLKVVQSHIRKLVCIRVGPGCGILLSEDVLHGSLLCSILRVYQPQYRTLPSIPYASLLSTFSYLSLTGIMF